MRHANNNNVLKLCNSKQINAKHTRMLVIISAQRQLTITTAAIKSHVYAGKYICCNNNNNKKSQIDSLKSASGRLAIYVC